MTIRVPEFLYNPTPRDFFIGDLGVKVFSGKPLDLYRANKEMTPSRAIQSLLTGDLGKAEMAGKIVILDKMPEYKPYMTQVQVSTKPLPSKVMCVASKTAAKQQNFIQNLQDEFLENTFLKSENENAQQAEKIINTFDLDGFQDPLGEEDWLDK